MGALPCEIAARYIAEVAVGGCLFIDRQTQVQGINDSQRGQFKAAIYCIAELFLIHIGSERVDARDTGSAMPIA